MHHRRDSRAIAQDRGSCAEGDLRHGGFTLIELLVAVVILGILAAVVVFAVAGVTDKGQENACEIEARSVRTAQEARHFREGSYSADVDDLHADGYLSETPTLVTATGSTDDDLQLQWASATCSGIAGIANP